MTTEQFDTVIIGGGQAGLSTAYHLSTRGERCVVLDAHDHVGDIWRQRFDSLRLYSPAKYDGLPGWAFPVARWTYPTKDQVADYLEAYAARFDCRCAAACASTPWRTEGTTSSCAPVTGPSRPTTS